MQVDLPTKPWYQSLTIWVNIVGTLLAVVTLIVDGATDLHIPAQAVVYLLAAQGVITVVLRSLRANLPIGPEGGVRTLVIPPKPPDPGLPDPSLNPEGDPRV